MVRFPKITGLVAIGMSLALNAQDSVAQDDGIVRFSQAAPRGRPNFPPSYDDTIARLSQEIRNRPDYPIPYYQRAQAYLQKGNTDRAIADLTEAINLAQRTRGAYDSGRWYFLRGVAYSKKGNTDRAIADLTEAMHRRSLFGTAVPKTLNNPYGWPCPRGYNPKGTSSCDLFDLYAMERSLGGGSVAARRTMAEAALSAIEWNAQLTSRVQEDREAREKQDRLEQEVERERTQAHEAEAEKRRAEARKRYAEERQRAAEARRKAAEAIVQDKGHATEATRKAAEAAAAAKRLADEEDRRAAQAEQRAAEAESRAAKIVLAEREAEAREKQRQLEADARERQRLGIFGEQELSDIINAADHNTVRFEKNYKGKTFSGVGLFDQAGKANFGIGNDLAVHLNVRNGKIVCFIDKNKADVVADWHAGTRVKFTGTISTTALLGGTLQLQNCTMTAG